MENNIEIPEEAEILIATDYIKDIVEGQTEIVDGLVKIALRNDIVLMKAVICEGLEKVENPTAEGLHALGRLIAASSKFINHSPEEEAFEFSKDKHRKATAVEHLKILLKPEASLDFLIELWMTNMLLLTSDEDLVEALLCVREGDTFQLSKFANALNLIYVVRFDDVSLEDRIKGATISEELSNQLRATALQ